MTQIDSDAQLLSLYCQGDLAAFETLYSRYEAKVFFYLKKKLFYHNEEKLREVHQDIFLKLHRKKHLFKSDRSFPAWFFTVINNHINDHLRKSQRSPQTTELNEAIHPAVSPQANESIVFTKFKELNTQEVNILNERINNDLSHQDIAERLQLKESNVRKIYSRAIKKLKGKELNL